MLPEVSRCIMHAMPLFYGRNSVILAFPTPRRHGMALGRSSESIASKSSERSTHICRTVHLGI